MATSTFRSSTYGGVIPLGFGVQKVAGTIIWATDIEEEKRTRTEGEGIFGWGGQDVTEYFYYGNFAVAFGEGPAVDVLRLWAGSKLIFDRRDPVAAMPEGWDSSPAGLFTGNSKYKYKIHLGTEDQEPDGLIVRKVLEETGEADAVPAHRGLVYIVFDRLPLAEWNNRIPPITAEIAWSGDRPATVRNATFLPHDGGTSFQRPGIAVDFARGYIYLEGNGGMHRIRTSDMQEDLHVGADISPVLVDFEGQHLQHRPDHGPKVLRQQLCAARDHGRAERACHRPDVGLLAARLAARLPAGHEPVRRLPHPGRRSAGVRARGERPRQALGRAGHLGPTPWLCGGGGPYRHLRGLVRRQPLDHGRPDGDHADPACRSEELAFTLSRSPARLDREGEASRSPRPTSESTMLSAPAYDEQNDRLILTVLDDGTRHLISYGKDDGIVWMPAAGDLPDQARFTGGKIHL